MWETVNKQSSKLTSKMIEEGQSAKEKIKQGEGLETDCRRGRFGMRDKKDFLGSQHLGRDLSGEKPAMWEAGAGGRVRGTAGVHLLGRSQAGVSEEQRGGEEG